MCKKRLFIISSAIFLAGCMATGQPGTESGRPVIPIRNYASIQETGPNRFNRFPEPSGFTICYGHTCRYFANVQLDTEEWSGIETIFKNGADTPEQERENIRLAVARLENIVGERTGTAGDLGENIAGLGQPGQMDCVDESTNTTVYLTLMKNAGLLHWHSVGSRASRGVMTLQVPHFTAVISDSRSGLEYAVDSWFLDNGQPPFIVPVDEWQAGWKP